MGLRAQIIAALSLALGGAIVLLSALSVQLTAKTRQAEWRTGAERTAQVALLAISQASPMERGPLLLGVVGQQEIAGARFSRGEDVWTDGSEKGEEVRVISNAGEFTLWFHQQPSASDPTTVRPLLLYVGITGLFVLLLAYVALTYLIVRPVSLLTRASERLAEGGSAKVPVRGPKEIVRLARSFNHMEEQLRQERSELETRLLELTQATTELREAQNQLVRSERLASVGRLSAGVAHEIGNPLAAILGLVDLLRGGDLSPDEQQEFLTRVHKETERINRTIADLLDFSRPIPDDQKGDVSEAVEDAIALVTPQADLKDITLERRLHDVAMVAVSTDRLRQLTLNLLLNAADAIEGAGSICVEVQTVGRQVEILVTDTGPGLHPEVIDHLFEPFVTTKSAGQGTGLGLAVCYSIVDHAGGSIDAENRPEGGALFRVLLPTILPERVSSS